MISFHYQWGQNGITWLKWKKISKYVSDCGIVYISPQCNGECSKLFRNMYVIYPRHARLGAYTSDFQVALSSLTNNRGEMGEKALVHILWGCGSQMLSFISPNRTSHCQASEEFPAFVKESIFLENLFFLMVRMSLNCVAVSLEIREGDMLKRNACIWWLD